MLSNPMRVAMQMQYHSYELFVRIKPNEMQNSMAMPLLIKKKSSTKYTTKIENAPKKMPETKALNTCSENIAKQKLQKMNYKK